MVFNSFSYFIFLPVVFMLFLLTPDRWRWLLLLLASYVFYGFLLKPALLAVLTIVILVTFWSGKLIYQAHDLPSRKRMLWVGVAANLSLLFYFKYTPFLVQNLNVLLTPITGGFTLEVPPLMVSIGISFFIFQAISYQADIYFRTTKPESHLGYLALYLSFFPKLLQGPIERSINLLSQLKKPYRFDFDVMRSGILLFTWGLFKKVVIADRLGLYADQVYNHVHDYTGISLIIGTYAYAFQIYFDFCGYTDMARGTGRLFGINLTENFNSPYLATSVTEFWRRWHISLSSWILEYVFEPLQMKFRNYGKLGVVSALLMTFFLCGLWHGAGWTYIIWGLIHGIYLSVNFICKPYRKKLYKWLDIGKSTLLRCWQVFITFNLVSIADVFFRANSVVDAWYVFSHLFDFTHIYYYLKINNINTFVKNCIFIDHTRYEFVTVIILLSVMGIVSRYRNMVIFDKPIWYRWTCYYSILFSILFLRVSTSSKFIYFNF